MNHMRAIEIAAPGDADQLRLVQRPIPQPKPNDVQIQIAYAGVNRPDVLQRMGAYKAPPGASDLPGLEAAGTISAIGANVTEWQIGDTVCALLPGGGYAEFATCPASHCLPIPKGLSLAEAAALPETFFTVWSTVFERGRLHAGETLLVHGGSSGIGTTAIQLAAARGARVFTTAGSETKCDVCRTLGAELAINYQTDDFVEAVRENGGADVVLDMVGGSYIPRNIKTLKEDGRLIHIAFLESPKAELNFAQIMLKRLTITGATLRPQSDAAKTRYRDALRAEVWSLLEAGQIRPVMDQNFPLEHASKAHHRMESSEHIGKIMLSVR